MHRSVLLPLGLIFVALVALVSPSGNFPLNDSWFYAETVEHLVAGRGYVVNATSAPAALLHYLWGALVSSILGYSFTTLRIATLMTSLLAVWATARAALTCGASHRTALLAALVLFCNPIFMNLSYVFMTDVPSLFPQAVAGIFYLRAIRSSRWTDYAVGSIFVVLAALVRQFGLFVGAAFIVSSSIAMLISRKKVSLPCLMAFTLPFLAGIGIYLLVPGLRGVTEWPPGYAKPTLPQVLLRWPRQVAVSLTYMGLFILPLSAGIATQLICKKRKWQKGQWIVLPWMLLCVVIFTAHIYQGGTFIWIRPLPMLPNILYDIGTGPLTLRDTLTPETSPIRIGAWWWLIATAAFSAISILLTDVIPTLYSRTVSFFRSRPDKTSEDDSWVCFRQQLFLFCWAFCFIAAPYHAVMPFPFDRYLLPAIIPLAVLAAARMADSQGRAATTVTCLLICIFTAFSTVSVHDYLAWNRARWQGLDFLRNTLDADPLEIDGGYEYNGMFLKKHFEETMNTSSFHEQGPKGFWVLREKYAVSFHPREGFHSIKAMPYPSWMKRTDRELLVLKRNRQAREDPVPGPDSSDKESQ